MRIALQNPMFADLKGVNGWMLEFIRIYNPIIYISSTKHLGWALYRWYKHKLNPFSYMKWSRVTFSKKKLNQAADVLVCFNGKPYLEPNSPVKEFEGMKVYHLMDYSYFPSESYNVLVDGDVDFVLGYNRHDKHSDFFKEKFPKYIDKVIPAPFGFTSRFEDKTPFAERLNKCIALGSVNSYVDPLHDRADFKEINQYFLDRGEKFMHKFRRMLVEREGDLKEIMDSKLPHYPETKDFGYNIVDVFNRYRMFVSCESLEYFPAAKAFEGPASGCVMVCSTHPSFTELGFEDGVNCIKHEEFDVEDFRRKVTYYIDHPDKLKKIQEAGKKFVRENYSYETVARHVFNSIKEKYGKETPKG